MGQTDLSKRHRADVSYVTTGMHCCAASPARRAQSHPRSDNRDKSPHRTQDGELSSGEYIRRAGNGGSTAAGSLGLHYHHRLEDWLGRREVRWVLGKLAQDDSDGLTSLERILASYRNPSAPRAERIKYWLFHRFIDYMRGDVDASTFRRRLAGHAPTVRGLVTVARSIAQFGLTVPQRFTAPLFAVWNLTNRCNLTCKHCYQDSTTNAPADELALDEKLSVVDQMGRTHVPMLALSGGEPTLSGDLLPVLRRAQRYDIHTTIATNGTSITPALADKLVAAGLRYVEISLDSVDPDRHDAFRGVKGMWARAVCGAKTVVATEGLRLGIAMCVHRGNFHELGDMIAFAERIGASCFAHFNFIPVGRGAKMVHDDITPSQREQLLAVLNAKMQEGRIGIISTAPQLGRICLVGAPAGVGRVACSHAGSGNGVQARVVAKYLGGCGAGRTYVCIEPNGDVTPCVYLPHRVMGNVRESPLVDIFRNSDLWEVLNDRDDRLHHCEVCALRCYCGGCRARADAYFGQLHAGDPGCIFNQKHWDRLVANGVVVQESQIPPDQLELSCTGHGVA